MLLPKHCSVEVPTARTVFSRLDEKEVRSVGQCCPVHLLKINCISYGMYCPEQTLAKILCHYCLCISITY